MKGGYVRSGDGSLVLGHFLFFSFLFFSFLLFSFLILNKSIDWEGGMSEWDKLKVKYLVGSLPPGHTPRHTVLVRVLVRIAFIK